MPLTRHWRLLCPISDSFTAPEAIEFLMVALPKRCIGKSITRVTCVRLLEKFLGLGFIFNVRAPTDLQFRDDKDSIFRFNNQKIEYEILKTSASQMNNSPLL